MNKDNTFYLIPKAGLLVRDPVTTEPLPAEGAFKPRNTYWLRQVRVGDAEIGKPPKKSQDATKRDGK